MQMKEITKRAGLVSLLTLLMLCESAQASGLEDMQRIAQATFPNACAPVEIDASHTETSPDPRALAWAYSPLLWPGQACRVVLSPGFEALRPTKTLEEAEAVLRARRIPFRRVLLPMDTLRTDPRLSAADANLPPGEPFVVPGVSGFTVNRVRGSQVRPVTGAQAEAVARELMRAERINKALKDRVDTLRKEQVVYGPAFAPKAPAN